MAKTRRDFFLLWGQASLLAAQHVDTLVSNPATRGGVFSESERNTLRRAAAILIPADERSGGAAAAAVERYIELILGSGAEALKAEWRRGLDVLNKARNMEARLTQMAKNEFSPRTPDEFFFVLLKSAVVEAFYTSEEGITKELGYRAWAI